MTLLTMVNEAQDTLSLPRSGIVATSTDDNVRVLFALANQEGRALARRYPWEGIVKEHTWTSVATAAQTSSVPSDYDRYVNESMFNRTNTRTVTGPMSPDEWQSQQALTASLLTDAFRFQGGTILISPTPSAGDTYAYEYTSRNWCQSASGTGQRVWMADDDTGILDESLMVLGLIWRFRKARGFDYAEEMATYEVEVSQAQMRDGGKRRLHYGGDASLYDHSRGPYIPEGSWSL